MNKSRIIPSLISVFVAPTKMVYKLRLQDRWARKPELPKRYSDGLGFVPGRLSKGLRKFGHCEPRSIADDILPGRLGYEGLDDGAGVFLVCDPRELEVFVQPGSEAYGPVLALGVVLA